MLAARLRPQTTNSAKTSRIIQQTKKHKSNKQTESAKTDILASPKSKIMLKDIMSKINHGQTQA